MGTGQQSNASVWQMLHRRLNNPSDDRGNETTVIDEAITVVLADSGADAWNEDASSYLRERQVTARLVTHPLTLHGAVFPTVAAFLATGAPSFTPPWLSGSLPPGVHLHSLLARDGWYPPAPGNATGGGGGDTSGSAIALRLQQLPYAPPVTVDLSEWLAGLASAGANATEATSDLNEGAAAAAAKRFVWRSLSSSPTNGQPSAPTVKSRGEGVPTGSPLEAPFPVTFDVEAVRSFVITLPSRHEAAASAPRGAADGA